MSEQCSRRLRCFATMYVSVSLVAWGGGLGSAQTPDYEVLDTIRLKSGQEIRAKFLSESSEEGKPHVLFQTPDGATWKLPMGGVVAKVLRADPEEYEYAEMLKSLEDTPQAHWAMYNWLSRQTSRKSTFRRQREYHLERIVALDPTDERAFRLLNYVEVNGRWINEPILYEHHGYTKWQGKWMPVLMAELKRSQEREESRIGELAIALQRWKRYVLGKEPPAEAQKKLLELVVPETLALVDRMISDEDDPQIRRLYVDAIGRIGTPHARNLLIKYAILDGAAMVRERAASLLVQPHYNPYQATTVAAAYLAHPSNEIVVRAAKLIRQIGADNAVFYLKDVVVTKHVVATGSDPGRTSASFSPDGSLNSFGVGGGPSKKIVEIQNRDVLAALRELTGVDFGYDMEKWKQWYVQNYTVQESDLRGDE